MMPCGILNFLVILVRSQPKQPQLNQLAVKLVRWPWKTYTAALHKGGNGISYEHNVL